VRSEEGRVRPSAGLRRGMATVVVFFVLLVLSIGVFSYFSFMRGRRLLQYRQLFGEFAYELALAGMELTRSDVMASLSTPGSTMYQKVIKAQNDEPWGHTGRIRLARIDFLASSYRPLINQVSEAFGGIANVGKLRSEVYALPEDIDSFAPVPWAKKLQDTRQKSGRIYIEVESEFKAGALLEAVGRKLKGYFEFRVMSPLLPVFNHFTLHLTDPMGGGVSQADLNCAETDFRGLVSTGPGPIVLNNGDTIDAGEAHAVMDARWLAKQGLVFLGRKNEVRLNLAFSHDAKENPQQAGEDFLFYQESVDPNVRESQRAYADAAVNAKLGNPFWEVRYWDQGVSRLEDTELRFYKQAYDPAEVASFRSSLLHLMGAPPRGVSPTLVLGRVSAGFLRLTAANPKGATDPDQFSALFTLLPGTSDPAASYPQWHAAVPDQGGSLDVQAAKLLPMAPGKFVFVEPTTLAITPAASPAVAPALYSEMMSKLTTRPYNKGLLHFKGENHEPEPTAQASGIGLPGELFESSADGAALNKIPKELLPELPDQGQFDELEQDGLISQLDQPFPDPARVARRSGSARDLRQFLEQQGFLLDGELNLGTILVWEQPGVCALPEMNLKRGGMIVADAFSLEGAINGEPEDPPLVLVARSGNIRLAENKPVFAVLVAPKGVIEAPKGLDVTGAIIAQGLDLKNFQGRGLSHLQYNPRFKVGPWSRTGAASGTVDPGWSLVVDRAADFVMVQ
jgi:hypothetical protein